MFGLDVRAAVLTRFVARKENHASRPLRVAFKHKVTLGDSPKRSSQVLQSPVLSVWSMRSASQLAAQLTPRALKLVGARYIVPSSRDHHTHLPPVAPFGKIGPCSGRSLDRFFAILERASFFFICSAGLSCKCVPPASFFCLA